MRLSLAEIIPFIFLYVAECRDIASYQRLQEDQEHVHQKKPIIPILKHSFEQQHDSYQYSFQTANGIHAHETGYIKNKGDKDHESLVQQGKVTYHDEHGNPITLSYVADEDGFRPQGDHLPTPPPIPEEIQKALKENQYQIEEDEVQEVVDEKQEDDAADAYNVQYQPQSYGHAQTVHHPQRYQ